MTSHGIFWTALLVFLKFWTIPIFCEAQGRLIEPPSRASMWRFGFRNPVDYKWVRCSFIYSIKRKYQLHHIHVLNSQTHLNITSVWYFVFYRLLLISARFLLHENDLILLSAYGQFWSQAKRSSLNLAAPLSLASLGTTSRTAGGSRCNGASTGGDAACVGTPGTFLPLDPMRPGGDTAGTELSSSSIRRVRWDMVMCMVASSYIHKSKGECPGVLLCVDALFIIRYVFLYCVFPFIPESWPPPIQNAKNKPPLFVQPVKVVSELTGDEDTGHMEYRLCPRASTRDPETPSCFSEPLKVTTHTHAPLHNCLFIQVYVMCVLTFVFLDM